MKPVRLTLLVAAIASLAACSQPASDTEAVADSTDNSPPMENSAPAESVEIEPGLTMRILQEGGGEVATAGQIAVVHYTGWLYDETQPDNRGQKFDSSVDRGQHFPFPLGGGRVIQGWDRGVVGMKVGETRELTIAPELAYGNRSIGPIPAGSTLVFEVDLAELKSLEDAAQ